VVVVGPAVVVVVDVLVEDVLVEDVLVEDVLVEDVLVEDVVVVAEVVVVVWSTVVPVVPGGAGNAGRMIMGVVVVPGTEVVVVLRVVEVLEVVTPVEPTAGLGLELVVPGRAGPAKVKTTRFVNEDVLLRTTRARDTVTSLVRGSLPMRTPAEYFPLAQLLGLCEYTTTTDRWERSVSWHQVACCTMPVTST
jgi:hypothetical protein